MLAKEFGYQGLGSLASKPFNLQLTEGKKRIEKDRSKMTYFVKHTWMRQMKYLFGDDTLNLTEALFLEDDAVLTYDALLTASVLLEQKAHSLDVHSICLGGWSGQNSFNAHPDTFLKQLWNYNQAMAYSVNRP